MTATAQGARLACDFAGCREAGTVEHEAWVFCADHAQPGKTFAAPAPAARPRPIAVPAPPAAAKPVVILDDVTAAEAQHGIRPAAPSPIGQLLEQASAHSSPKVRRLGDRIEAQLAELRTLLADLAADEARRKAEQEAADKALAEVARLEAALAAAKAKLPAAVGRGNRAPRSAAQIEAARRNVLKAHAARAAKAGAA